MANKKISELTAASASDGTEVTPVVQSSSTVKMSVAQMAAFGANGSMSRRPVTADADDEEFEDGLGGWTQGAAYDSGNAVDPYATLGLSDGFRQDINNLVPSCAIWQPDRRSVSGTPVTFTPMVHKAHTYATNECIWAKLMSSRKAPSSSATDNDASIGLFLSATSSGVPDFDNGLWIFASEVDGGAVDIQVIAYTGGVGVGLSSPSTASMDSEYNGSLYVAVQKRGTAYDFWFNSTESPLNWRWLCETSSAYATSLDRVAVCASNASTTSPGSLLVGCDFVRFRETSKGPYDLF